MKTATILIAALVSSAAFGPSFAADPHMGTWKLNEEKSKPNPEAGKNLMVVYAEEGDKVKVTVEGVDKDGKRTRNEWIGKFDGKDYPVIGDRTSDMRAYRRIDDHTLALTVKKDGKVTLSGRSYVSAEGDMRTVTLTGTDLAGKKIVTKSVYEKL